MTTTRRIRTSAGEFMRFLTIEDRTGTVEAVIFPNAYRRYGHLLRGHGPYLMAGKVENTHGATTLTVSHLELAPTKEEPRGW